MVDTADVRFEVLAERPVVRNDEPSDIDIAVEIQTMRAIASSAAPNYAINLCVVIDRSASMGSGNKLEHAKNSCIEILDSLSEQDHFTVLAFDESVYSIANPQTPRGEVKRQITSLTTGGATNLSKGWYHGLLELQTYR